VGRIKPRRGGPRSASRVGRYYEEIMQLPEDLDPEQWAAWVRSQVDSPEVARLAGLVERWGRLYREAGRDFPAQAVDWIDAQLASGTLAVLSPARPGQLATVAELLADPEASASGVTTPEALAESLHRLHAAGHLVVDDAGMMHAVVEPAEWTRRRPHLGPGLSAAA